MKGCYIYFKNCNILTLLNIWNCVSRSLKHNGKKICKKENLILFLENLLDKRKSLIEIVCLCQLKRKPIVLIFKSIMGVKKRIKFNKFQEQLL
jgi:hypothetical protein